MKVRCLSFSHHKLSFVNVYLLQISILTSWKWGIMSLDKQQLVFLFQYQIKLYLNYVANNGPVYPSTLKSLDGNYPSVRIIFEQLSQNEPLPVLGCLVKKKKSSSTTRPPKNSVHYKLKFQFSLRQLTWFLLWHWVYFLLDVLKE